MQNIYDVDKPDIIVCTPMRQTSSQMVSVEWHRCRQNLIPPFGRTYREIAIDGKEIGEARCEAAEFAMKIGSEFLFFNDYDTILPPTTLHRLIYDADNYPECDVFSGVYCVKQEPPFPLIFKDGKTFWDWTPGDILIDGINGFGMGCCLIRTKVFKDLEKPYFQTMEKITEDIYFLNKCKVLLNSKFLVDTNILCTHQCYKTGRFYGLPDDSLPMRKWNEKNNTI